MQKLINKVIKFINEVIFKNKPDLPGNEPDSIEEADMVKFSLLRWVYGGFNGGGATLSTPRISNLKVNSNGMSLKWNIGLASWGLSATSAGALACLFCKVDGKWRGGKFDWISTSRSTRDFKNIQKGYNSWSISDFNRAEAYAFVVVSADGKKRSNIITTER